ncbi:Hypothetical_protein [Hexamita inflata]|uniref:Hypothetical_protein n=1 Tax=Hexamita inflata TaxID=28002 RepID=A0ABP1H6F8_9EUKA
MAINYQLTAISLHRVIRAKNHQNQFYSGSQKRFTSQIAEGLQKLVQIQFRPRQQKRFHQVNFEHNFDSWFGHVHQFEPKRSTKSNALWSDGTTARQRLNKQIGQLGKQLSKEQEVCWKLDNAK